MFSLLKNLFLLQYRNIFGGKNFFLKVLKFKITNIKNLQILLNITHLYLTLKFLY